MYWLEMQVKINQSNTGDIKFEEDSIVNKMLSTQNAGSFTHSHFFLFI